MQLSIPSNFLFFPFLLNLLHFLLYFFHNLEGSSNSVYFAKKGDGLLTNPTSTHALSRLGTRVSFSFHDLQLSEGILCRLDRDDTLDEVPQNKKQNIATGLLLDKLHKQDFAGPL